MKRYTQKNIISNTNTPRPSPSSIPPTSHASVVTLSPEAPTPGPQSPPLPSALVSGLLAAFPAQSLTPPPPLKVRFLSPLCVLSPFSLKRPVLIAAHFALLPTPSPELGHPSVHPHHQSHDFFMQSSQSALAWDSMRTESSVSTGSKRSHDYNVDDFLIDMKKRRVNPSYDPR